MPGSDHRQRNRRIALAISAVLLVVVDPLWGTAAWPTAVAIKTALVVALAVGLLLTTREGWRRHLGSATAALGLPAALTGLNLISGGQQSVYYFVLATMPLGYAVIVPNQPAMTGLCGGAALVGGLAVALGDGASRSTLLHWIGLGVPPVVLGVYASFVYRRVHRAELSAEAAQAKAMEELAHSERLRAKSERLASIGQLAAGISHEVNNPLGFVKSNVGWLKDRLAELKDPEVDEVIADTSEGIGRIQRIVAELSSFAAGALGGKAEACELGPLVHAALASARGSLPKAPVEVTLPPRAMVRASPHHVTRVLTVLLANAGDAVRTQPGAGRIRVHGELVTGHFELRVDDDGPGIAPETLAHLFEPFFTTKDIGEGRGLGLALAREYVRQMGGELSAENLPGSGARFTLRLPMPSVPPPSGTTTRPAA